MSIDDPTAKLIARQLLDDLPAVASSVAPKRDRALVDEVVTRLTSRKFLAAVGMTTTLCLAHRWSEALSVALAYIGVQASIDHRQITADKAPTPVATTVVNNVEQPSFMSTPDVPL